MRRRYQCARIQLGAAIRAGADDVFCDATMQSATIPPNQRMVAIAFILLPVVGAVYAGIELMR
jgi:hypothetical protein